MNRKEGFVPVDVEAVLRAVAGLPMMRWRYKGQAVAHLGPMVQDFHAVFAVGKGFLKPGVYCTLP